MFSKALTFAIIVNIVLVALSFFTPMVQGNMVFELALVESHHVAQLNSHQPYVAGFQVRNENLRDYGTVDAVAVTVSFPSVETDHFPPNSWLGAGLFVQAQDHVYRNVDYGFYMMLVLDSTGKFFLDLGLHQTRETTAPLQMPTEELIYAYTWQLFELAPATPVDLVSWLDSESFANYQIFASGHNVTLPRINVTAYEPCKNIISDYYGGNVIVNPFPSSVYVNYFQFGVISSESIVTSHWSVSIKEPRVIPLRASEWSLVDLAWSTEGGISYLDHDWKWGGTPYHGVNALYHQHPLEDPYEVFFSYTGANLAPGTVLWDGRNTTSSPNNQHLLPDSFEDSALLSSCIVIGAGILVYSAFGSRSVRVKVKSVISRFNQSLSSRSEVAEKLACAHTPKEL